MTQEHISPGRERRQRNWWIRIAISVSAAVVLVLFGAFALANNTQIIVGLLQGYQSQNSFEPRASPASHIRDNGVRYVNDIAYGHDFPNSYLDISYPPDAARDHQSSPTVVFFHGGGYLGGDKVMGDPLAMDNDVNYLFDKFLEAGYTLVNVNYALVPEFHFPTPVLQLDQAVGFLRDNAQKFGLDMDNVIIMGSSAGAIMTAQYGAILSNPDYARDYDLTPSIPLESVRALIIDDAPLIFDEFSTATKVLVGNYIDGTIHPSESEKNRYNPIDNVNVLYPASFLIGSNYGGDGYAHDMEQLANALKTHNVRHDFFYERRADGSQANHGLLGGLSTGDPIAADAFNRMIAFMNSTRKS
jgi:acetyl esterase/lipase